jgi:hypothetical protein
MSTPDRCLNAADQWSFLAVQERERAVYESQAFRHDVSSFYVRAEIYDRTATALRMEAVDGKSRCSCHLLTSAEREARGMARG